MQQSPAALCSGCHSGTEFIPHLLHFLLLCAIRLIPSLAGHFRIDLSLHAEGFIQRTAEALGDFRGRGFNGAVQKQITGTLLKVEQIFHHVLVVHVTLLSGLQQAIEAPEDLTVAVSHLLHTAPELGILQRLYGFAALLLEEGLVSERILHIKQFLGCHTITSAFSMDGHAGFIQPGERFLKNLCSKLPLLFPFVSGILIIDRVAKA